MSWEWPEEINHLKGCGIKLEPLALDHIPGLVKAASTATDHEHDMGFVPTPDDISVYVYRALAEKKARGGAFHSPYASPMGSQ